MTAAQQATTSLFRVWIAKMMLKAAKIKNGASLTSRGTSHCAQSNHGSDDGPLPRFGMMKKKITVRARRASPTSRIHRFLIAARNANRNAGVVAQKAAPFHEGSTYGASACQNFQSGEFGNI